MSLMRCCDWCGREIEDGMPFATVDASVSGRKRDVSHVTGWLGHYHVERVAGRDCLTKLSESVALAHGAAQTLEAIPVASGQKVASLRKKHRPAPPAPWSPSAVSIDAGALAAVAAVVSAKAAEGAELLELTPELDGPAVSYLRDLAGGARALVEQLPEAVRGDLVVHVDRLSAALAPAGGGRDA